MITLDNFQNELGHHCSSSSIYNMLRFDGLPISEAMVLGLGSGINFICMKVPGGSPTMMLNGRCFDLEGRFYRNIGHSLRWAGEWSPENMADILMQNRPILARTDLYYLPYYQPRVHFPGHAVVVTGIDLDAATIQLADVAGKAPFTIALDQFEQALSANVPQLVSPNDWVAPPILSFDEIVSVTTIRRSIQLTVTGMLHASPPSKRSALARMRQVADTLPEWAQFDDWQWCARFAYQTIEKRGTGGGSFRRLYARFLTEAAAYLPELSGLDEQTYRIADQWTEMAQTCKQISLQADPSRFAEAGEQLHAIAEAESVLMHNLQRAIEPVSSKQ